MKPFFTGKYATPFNHAFGQDCPLTPAFDVSTVYPLEGDAVADETHGVLRRCLREPIGAIYQAAGRLDAAVEAHLGGHNERAAELIRQADCDAVRRWVEPLMGSISQFPERKQLVAYRSVAEAPPTLPKAERTTPRMPNREGEQRIIARDGYHCVFCSIPVISSAARRRLTHLYPTEAYWGARCHAALWCMWLQFDHVLPHGRGGTSDDGNMVITCAGCNYGRMALTLEEVGLVDPRGFPRSESGWDGLNRILAA